MPSFIHSDSAVPAALFAPGHVDYQWHVTYINPSCQVDTPEPDKKHTFFSRDKANMWFGIPALVATGMTWSLVGVISGSAPKHGLQMSLVQLLGGLTSLVIGICVLLTTGSLTQATPEAIRYVIVCCLLSGIGNYALLQLMSRAMQTGPNGIIWSIVQSGLIFPFTMGILFFNVELNAWKVCGIIMIITALAIFGTAKDNSASGSRKWLLFAFTAFVICGIQQSINSLPSYRDDCTGLSVLKSLMNSTGVVLAALFGQLTGLEARRLADANGNQLHGPKAFLAALRQHLGSRFMWGYIAMQQGFHVITSYLLMYRGMDAMRAAGLGNVSYPLLVSSCIVGFFLYSLIFLREKVRPIQFLGLALCIGGIAAICVKSAA